MTFTIDTGILSNASQLASGGALLGLGIVAFVLFLFWKIAKWGDEKAGNTQQYNDKQGGGFLIIVLIILAIISASYAGQSTGHTTLITSPGQARMWG